MYMRALDIESGNLVTGLYVKSKRNDKLSIAHQLLVDPQGSASLCLTVMFLSSRLLFRLLLKSLNFIELITV